MQRATTSHNKPQHLQHPQRAATKHNASQRATTNNNEPQQLTKSHNDPQRATATHNSDSVIETHKKLHRLVYALSPLNALTAGILMEIVLMLVPQVRSTRRRLLVLIQCSGIILFVVEAFERLFVLVILRNWQLKG